MPFYYLVTLLTEKRTNQIFYTNPSQVPLLFRVILFLANQDLLAPQNGKGVLQQNSKYRGHRIITAIEDTRRDLFATVIRILPDSSSYLDSSHKKGSLFNVMEAKPNPVFCTYKQQAIHRKRVCLAVKKCNCLVIKRKGYLSVPMLGKPSRPELVHS